MKAYVFPGQGSQFIGMGKDLYEKYPQARELFEKANELLAFRITDIMFNGTEDELKQTKVTQPAIFLHSVITAFLMGSDFKPDLVAGHSLGEFSALVANRSLLFEDALLLVYKRALAMQKACEHNQGTMAAVIGADDVLVEQICSEVNDIVVPANYNCIGQLVISGSVTGIEKAINLLQQHGVKRVMKLNVSGAFHSPLMEIAKVELAKAIETTNFYSPICPIYQNVNANAVTEPQQIKQNLIAQLTSPVRWTQTIQNMIYNGATSFTEVGPGKVLQGLIKKINKDISVNSPLL